MNIGIHIECGWNTNLQLVLSLCLGTRQSCCRARDHFKPQNPQCGAKPRKRLWQELVFMRCEPEPESRASPCSAPAGHGHQATPFRCFLMVMSDHKNAIDINVGVAHEATKVAGSTVQCLSRMEPSVQNCWCQLRGFHQISHLFTRDQGPS